ncbi:MAG: hypothetical protein ABJA49_09600 [Betaproteobacteria bacterium]
MSAIESVRITVAPAAQVIIPKLHLALDAMMQQHPWPVTFSIGVLTWRGGVVQAEQLIALAGRLMYAIKRSGKDAIAYAVHGPDAPPIAAAADRVAPVSR